MSVFASGDNLNVIVVRSFYPTESFWLIRRLKELFRV